MRLISDYHTHSKYSRFFHGRNKIMEMAISANAMGLSEIGITDHGFKHLFRTNKAKLKKARAEIDEINTWSKTKVLLGVEADIISEDGKLDVDNETLAMLDILVIGYHRMIKTNFAGFFGNVPNTEEARKRCTRAFINAIN
ncbi:MAG: PHP domain-containing protein, partial [Clostridia bacterium]|nr:PHP domain-containing protein [Clostridia bacterium]